MFRNGLEESKITGEHGEEARELRAIWDAKKPMTQTVFAETYDIGNQTAVGARQKVGFVSSDRIKILTGCGHQHAAAEQEPGYRVRRCRTPLDRKVEMTTVSIHTVLDNIT